MNQTASAIVKSILCAPMVTLLLAIISPLKYIFPARFERYTYGIIGTIIALVVVAIFCRIDRRSFRQIGLSWRSDTLRNFLSGLIIGLALSITMMSWVIYSNGLSIRLVNDSNITAFVVSGMAMLFLSFMEEIAFRTYAFVNFCNYAGKWMAQIVIAILFALYHVAGGQDVLTSFLGPGTWAFIFGWAVLKSGGIAMATGIHFAANIFQAAIGQKKQYDGIWTIEMPLQMSEGIQSQLNLSGIIVQLALLILGIALTYRAKLAYSNRTVDGRM